ncbi:amidoligase family protein [Paenibacillus sp. MBLB4367]|uniref:amidoligase family protein n=1 Tax=Paenibacillus sp. MBLB4367 TaxID=3384767 RepID=UPI003907EC6D
MWPKAIDWQDLRFGVEIEFIGGAPESTELLPGWEMSLDERQIDETGNESGSELKPPPLRWEEREQIREMLNRLKLQGAAANWSCGLHVHVDLQQWGQAIVRPLLETALTAQDSLQSLLGMSEHRRIYCPPVTEEMTRRYSAEPGPDALRYRNGRPQSHRCGINAAAWFDIGTVEIRYANGSLDYDEIVRTVELCLRFVAAVGAGRRLPGNPERLAAELGAPADGYPAAVCPPQWYKERIWLEESLLPVLTPIANRLVPEGEIHHILPVPGGIVVAVENREGHLSTYKFLPSADGWELAGSFPAAE